MATRNSIRAPASSRDQPRVKTVEPAWPSPDGRTLVFVHGWPDSVDMWTPLIARLSRRGHTCVCVPLPWYPGGSDPEQADFNVAARDVARAARVAIETERASPPRAERQRVTLVCHDWGCVVGFKVQKLVPELIAAVVALDVGGDARGLSAKEKAFVVAYQAWLLAAHFVGGAIGDAMTTRFARFAGAPVTRNQDGSVSDAVVRARLNWPYVAFWRDVAPSVQSPREKGREERNGDETFAGGASASASDETRASRAFAPSCPVLFLFGGNKPARFHGDAWLAAIDAKRARGDGSAWREMKGAGHWFPVERADRTFEEIDRWLRETAPNGKEKTHAASEDDAGPVGVRSAV